MLPIANSPVGVTRIHSKLLVLNTSGWASVVPIKFVSADVPEFPVSDQLGVFTKRVQAVPFHK